MIPKIPGNLSRTRMLCTGTLFKIDSYYLGDLSGKKHLSMKAGNL